LVTWRWSFSNEATQSGDFLVENKCKIDGCKRVYRAKGYCTAHYQKWRKGAFGAKRYKICVSEGCRKQRSLGSHCEAHQKKRKDESAAA
jgi:hypothetical protein